MDRVVQLASDTLISVIECANDVVILSVNLENLNFMPKRVNYVSHHIGLEINLSKPWPNPFAQTLV